MVRAPIFGILFVLVVGKLSGLTQTTESRSTQVNPSGATTAPLSPALPAPLPRMTVVGSEDPIEVDPSVGTSTYTMNQSLIDTIAQGRNTSFNQVMTSLPGVSNDTYGAVHVRNEDPYYRYYLNGTLLPQGINGFSQDLDTRFIDTFTLLDGALPAYYNQGSYGVIELQTKSGAALNGGSVSFYGGSHETMHPSFTFGSSSVGTDFFATGSYVQNDLGLENPTGEAYALHDQTQQYKGFLDLSHQFQDAGKLSLIFSGASSSYEIPNVPGQTPFSYATDPGNPPFTTNPPNPVDSASLDERQHEQTYYGILAYQQTIDDFSYQLSQVNRFSSVLFNPDINGDLYYNGVAARVDQNIETNGLQGDFTSELNEAHTIRWGFIGETSQAIANHTTYVYHVDPTTQNPTYPETFADDQSIRAYDYALYFQDQWKITDQLTLNYGGRFEQVKAYTNESQFSPRLNAVYEIDQQTSLHGGYARYFIAPPLESIAPTSVNQLSGTTNAADQVTDDPAKAERDHYFDFGVTRKVLPDLTLGADTYYKIAKNQIDDGQFGAANIFSPYNYSSATFYGVEFSTSYRHEGFSAYGNFSASDSWAKHINSSQFEFSPDELAYLSTNNIHPDQSQYYTASVGTSYTWLDTTGHIDAIYGDGIRSGFANTGKLQPYYPVNLGIDHRFKNLADGDMILRFDVENVFDQVYVLNDGTGISEGAIKFGKRRGFFAGVTYEF